MIASLSMPIGFTRVIAAWPNGINGATPPAWLPIVVGSLWIAYPHLVWLHDKRSEAQVSDVNMIVAFVVGAALIVYGVHLWLRH